MQANPYKFQKQNINFNYRLPECKNLVGIQPQTQYYFETQYVQPVVRKINFTYVPKPNPIAGETSQVQHAKENERATIEDSPQGNQQYARQIYHGISDNIQRGGSHTVRADNHSSESKMSNQSENIKQEEKNRRLPKQQRIKFSIYSHNEENESLTIQEPKKSLFLHKLQSSDDKRQNQQVYPLKVKNFLIERFDSTNKGQQMKKVISSQLQMNSKDSISEEARKNSVTSLDYYKDESQLLLEKKEQQVFLQENEEGQISEGNKQESEKSERYKDFVEQLKQVLFSKGEDTQSEQIMHKFIVKQFRVKIKRKDINQ